MKYEFTGETKIVGDVTLRQIRALDAIVMFGVAAGDLGGWIEKEANLEQVYGDAQVCGNARVSVNIICASRSDGYIFLATPIKDKTVRIVAGCRYFTFDEARNHWGNTRGGTKLGDESLALVDHLERMAKLQGWC
jgi:hypothetical protein